MNYLTKIVLISLILFFSGCQKEVYVPNLYDWGDYIYTSPVYGMNKEDNKNIKKHILSLELIIKRALPRNKRVPPGIYAEYGQLLFEFNKKVQAKKYFLLEKYTYPESKTFIDRVIKRLYGETK